MKSSRYIVGFIAFLLGVSLFTGAEPVMGNPIFVPDLSVGGLWNNNTYIEMPFADVHIQIDYLGEATFEIAMVGNFTIRTNTTQDYALAFAYPESWTEGSIFHHEELFSITLDRNPIATWPLHLVNASWITMWGEDTFYILSARPDYVGFNLSLQAYVNHSLVVRSSFTKMTDYLNLGYVCGTALSFKGSTRERITIEVNQSTPLSRSGFSPGTNFTLINETLYKSAVWDLSFPDPIPWDGDYYPVDIVYAFLECFEEYIPPPTTTTTTTPEPTPSPISTTTTAPVPSPTPSSTQPDILGPVAFFGSFGVTVILGTIVLIKTKKG